MGRRQVDQVIKQMLMSGYGISYFSKVFRQVNGYSPSDYMLHTVSIFPESFMQ